MPEGPEGYPTFGPSPFWARGLRDYRSCFAYRVTNAPLTDSDGL